MLARLADLVASHRILVSRLFAIAFFVLMAVTESALKGRIISSVLFLIGLTLVGAAIVGRLWCSLYISGRKDSELITAGPYSISRNPLYFFSLLGFVGIGLATETLSFSVAFVLIFLLVYPATIRREEAFLHAKFGSAFIDYCARTPRFFPSLKAFNEPDWYVVNPRLVRRTMGDVLWFVWLVGIIALVEVLHEYGFMQPILRLP